MGPNQDGGRGWAGQTRNGPNGAKWEGENSGKRPPKAGNLGEIPAVTPPVTARKVAAALVQSFPRLLMSGRVDSTYSAPMRMRGLTLLFTVEWSEKSGASLPAGSSSTAPVPGLV